MCSMCEYDSAMEECMGSDAPEPNPILYQALMLIIPSFAIRRALFSAKPMELRRVVPMILTSLGLANEDEMVDLMLMRRFRWSGATVSIFKCVERAAHIAVAHTETARWIVDFAFLETSSSRPHMIEADDPGSDSGETVSR